MSVTRHKVFEQAPAARTEAPAGVAFRYVEDGRRRHFNGNEGGNMPKNLCRSSLCQPKTGLGGNQGGGEGLLCGLLCLFFCLFFQPKVLAYKYPLWALWGGRPFFFVFEGALQSQQGNFELCVRGGAGAEALQPHTGQGQPAQEARAIFSGGEALQLIGQACNGQHHGQFHENQQELVQPVAVVQPGHPGEEEHVKKHRHADDDKYKACTAAWVQRVKGPRIVHRQLFLGLISPNGLMLGPVVGEEVLYVFVFGQQKQIAHKHQKSQNAVNEVEGEAVGVQGNTRPGAQAPSQQMGQGDKEAQGEKGSQHQAKGHSASLRGRGGGPLRRGLGLLCRKLEGDIAVVQGLYQHHNAAEEGPAKKLE